MGEAHIIYGAVSLMVPQGFRRTQTGPARIRLRWNVKTKAFCYMSGVHSQIHTSYYAIKGEKIANFPGEKYDRQFILL